jgi:hypothetical protein
MRTLDPHLSQLRSVLRGPVAPTWIVVWRSLDPWRIDAQDRTRLLSPPCVVRRFSGHS